MLKSIVQNADKDLIWTIPNERQVLSIEEVIKGLEVLAKTEYQDLYRVTDGVLLVVNKFVPIEYENEKYFTVYRGKVKQGKI